MKLSNFNYLLLIYSKSWILQFYFRFRQDSRVIILHMAGEKVHAVQKWCLKHLASPFWLNTGGALCCFSLLRPSRSGQPLFFFFFTILGVSTQRHTSAVSYNAVTHYLIITMRFPRADVMWSSVFNRSFTCILGQLKQILYGPSRTAPKEINPANCKPPKLLQPRQRLHGSKTLSLQPRANRDQKTQTMLRAAPHFNSTSRVPAQNTRHQTSASPVWHPLTLEDGLEMYASKSIFTYCLGKVWCPLLESNLPPCHLANT